jgi:hypothetical protein
MINYTFDTLNYISNDIFNKNNPIKYHNKNYNNVWNINYEKLNNLINNLSNNLLFIINNKIDLSNVEIFEWTNIKHEYPLCYNQKIPYNQFIEKYQLRTIDLNYNYKLLIKKYTENLSEEILSILNDFQKGYFISLDIKFYVENNINKCYKYKFDHMDLYLLTNKLSEQLLKHIYIISKWIYNLNPIYKIKFIYFDTPLKKELNKVSNILSSQHVNSGLSSSNNYLMIWRKEEILKVLIHELIHYLNIDLKYDKNINKIIKKEIGKLKYPILINESITEIFTQFLHSIYISIYQKGSLIDNVKTIYNYEQIFSWYQFSKIMNFFNIYEFNKKLIYQRFNQSSNVFSYYILKSILTINFPSIILNLNTLDCNVYKCYIVEKYLNKTISKIPTKFLNKVIKNLKLNDNCLKMTVFNFY